MRSTFNVIFTIRIPSTWSRERPSERACNTRSSELFLIGSRSAICTISSTLVVSSLLCSRFKYIVDIEYQVYTHLQIWKENAGTQIEPLCAMKETFTFKSGMNFFASNKASLLDSLWLLQEPRSAGFKGALNLETYRSQIRFIRLSLDLDLNNLNGKNIVCQMCRCQLLPGGSVRGGN